MRAVLMLAEVGSFRRAARVLHVSQPALSQQIRGLERELGVALFERSRSGVRLTVAGEVFVTQMAGVAERIEDALAATRNAAAARMPALRVGVTEGVSEVMGHIVRRLLSANSRLDVQVLRRYPAQQLAEMASGRLDAGMAKLPVHGIEPGVHEQLVVARTPVRALLHAGHPLTSAPNLGLSQLADLPLILPAVRLAPGLNARLISEFTRRGLTPRLGPEADTFDHIVTLAAAGRGYALCARPGGLLPGSVALTEPISGIGPLEIGLIWLRTAHGPVLDLVALARQAGSGAQGGETRL